MSFSEIQVHCRQIQLYSTNLRRDITLSILLPDLPAEDADFPLVIFNDGQDFPALRMEEVFRSLLAQGAIRPMVIAGVHANENRIYEYGIASQPDYAGRGSRAALTTHFVTEELVPHLAAEFRTVTSKITYAGFSLGGLMALDAAWNRPDVFSGTGIFSGSLWWRQKALGEGYQAEDRIMHAQIRSASCKPELRFWFECGTWDETDDRDGDGVIDAIQDTLECIAELERKGYRWGSDIIYKEVHEGRHDQETWSRVMPSFLTWVSESL